MDNEKPAASRIRHILQAMERSIDSARSRRTTSAPAALPAPAVNQIRPGALPSTHATPTLNLAGRSAQGQSSANPNAAHSLPPLHSSSLSLTQPRASLSSPLIGANTVSPLPAPAPARDANAPQRLKAKPKRFESTFAAQFAQAPYRSQTG